MKKIILIMMMMLVASVGYGQVEDLFKRVDDAEKKAIKIRIDKEEDERRSAWINRCKKAVSEFANKLRGDGYDFTKLTEDEIDHLDELRIEKAKKKLLTVSYYEHSNENLLYTMPSHVFKEGMMKETKYYVRIERGFLGHYHALEDDIISCGADSTVYIDRGKYKINGKPYWVTFGDTIKVGRATLICNRQTNDMYIYNLAGKRVANDRQGYVELGIGTYVYRGRVIKIKKDSLFDCYGTIFSCK